MVSEIALSPRIPDLAEFKLQICAEKFLPEPFNLVLKINLRR